jgi:hypothetical protein
MFKLEALEELIGSIDIVGDCCLKANSSTTLVQEKIIPEELYANMKAYIQKARTEKYWQWKT